jgi:DNA-binding CsgD family transcriptional regulator
MTSIVEHETARSLLTPKQLEAWELVNVHRMTLRQAGNHIGISHVSVRSRLESADRILRAYSRSEFPARAQPERERPATDSLLAVNLLIQRDGPKCYLCQQIPDRYCVEHIIPTSQGGTDEGANLALACPHCNAKKGDYFVSLRVTSGSPVYHAPARVELLAPTRP